MIVCKLFLKRESRENCFQGDKPMKFEVGFCKGENQKAATPFTQQNHQETRHLEARATMGGKVDSWH